MSAGIDLSFNVSFEKLGAVVVFVNFDQPELDPLHIVIPSLGNIEIQQAKFAESIKEYPNQLQF